MGLPAACAAGLRCTPFVVPSAWAALPEQMAEELAAYSINLEAFIRKASSSPMRLDRDVVYGCILICLWTPACAGQAVCQCALIDHST